MKIVPGTLLKFACQSPDYIMRANQPCLARCGMQVGELVFAGDVMLVLGVIESCPHCRELGVAYVLHSRLSTVLQFHLLPHLLELALPRFRVISG